MKADLISILVILLWFVKNACSQITKNDVKAISIGLFYCDNDEFNKTEEILTELNRQKTSLKSSKQRYKFDLKGIKLDKDDNMITLSTTVCQEFINSNPIYAALVGETSCLNEEIDDYILTKTAISFTCGFYQLNNKCNWIKKCQLLLKIIKGGFYQIPVIDLYSQDAVFSDKVNIFKFVILISYSVFFKWI